jgi:hypothetical protein
VSRPNWTVIGVIAVVLVAGFLISVLFHLFWLVARLAIIAVVAVAVLFALRSLVARRGGRPSIKR